PYIHTNQTIQTKLQPIFPPPHIPQKTLPQILTPTPHPTIPPHTPHHYLQHLPQNLKPIK
ncbi:hypothetical protein, partial [Bacillus altitudinis]|uniref:hypothetical protein n=1 Tax=Bacillus altitudinis TaxID=293387 RepID=UPI001C92DBDE